VPASADRNGFLALAEYDNKTANVAHDGNIMAKILFSPVCAMARHEPQRNFEASELHPLFLSLDVAMIELEFQYIERTSLQRALPGKVWDARG